jgi:WS/DGAT/MGAT family acyltransferase
MMTVAQKLFDTGPEAPHRPPLSNGAPTSDFAENGHLLAPALNAIAHVSRNAMAMADTVLDVVTHPQQAMERAALVFNGAGMLVRELLKTDDPQSPLKGEFARRKLVAWSKPVAIKDVKAVGAPHDAKVNDVLVAAMTGALRNYLVRRGVKVNHTTLRAMVPVDLRSPERMGHLGNAFGLVILELAVNKARPEQRLSVTKTRMDALKRSPEAMATLILFDLLGRTPKGVEDFANDLFGSKASLVLTNVVGPREVLYLAGVPIDHMVGWAPHPGKQLGMAISIMSYRGMVSLTIITDAHLIPDPAVITDLFNTEFQTMLKVHKSNGTQAPLKEVAAKMPRTSKAPAKAAPNGPKRTSRPAA